MLLGDDGQTEEVPFKAKAKALGKTLYQTRHDRLNDYLYAKFQPFVFKLIYPYKQKDTFMACPCFLI